ncbi:amino acid transporter [Candidatus Dependentiae bacterium]|nr:amino acid transporter [Candidatus Dependentiae bacterium]
MRLDETPRRASVLSTACNLINCAIGTGVLRVPFAIRQTGAVLGGVTLCVVASITLFTLNVLCRGARVYRAQSYQELVRKSIGRVASHAVSLILVVCIFGTCVACTIVAADAFTEVNARCFGSNFPILTNRELIVSATSVGIALPLSLLRSVEQMAFASAFSVLALLVTAAIVVAKGLEPMSTLIREDVIHSRVHGGPSYGQTPWSSDDVPGKEEGGIKPWVFDTGTVLALPVFVFAFQCHAQVVSIFTELRDEEGDFGSNLETHSVTEIERDGAMDGESMGQTDETEEDDELFVDAMSQSGHGSVDGSSRGGSPAPTLYPRLNQDRRVSSGSGSNDGGVFGFVTRRRSSGASGSTLSMTLSLSPVRGRDRDPPARIPIRLHNPFNLGPGGFHGDGVTEIPGVLDEDAEERYFLEGKRSATMERVSFWSVLFVLVGYLLVGEFAYVADPHAPSDMSDTFNMFNMLTAYSTHDGTTTAATAMAGVSALVTYPVSHFVSRAALDDVYVAMAGKEPVPPGRAPLKRHVCQTVLFVGMTTATALLVRDLGVVFRVLGSIGGSLVVFIMPGILLLQPKYHAVGIDVDGSVGDGDGETQGADFGVGRVPTGETGDEEAAHGHRRARSRHWTEMGDSIGGYDELNFGSGEFLFITVRAIRMTSCFVHRISQWSPGLSFTSPGRRYYH